MLRIFCSLLLILNMVFSLPAFAGKNRTHAEQRFRGSSYRQTESYKGQSRRLGEKIAFFAPNGNIAATGQIYPKAYGTAPYTDCLNAEFPAAMRKALTDTLKDDAHNKTCTTYCSFDKEGYSGEWQWATGQCYGCETIETAGVRLIDHCIALGDEQIFNHNLTVGLALGIPAFIFVSCVVCRLCSLYCS